MTVNLTREKEQFEEIFSSHYVSLFKKAKYLISDEIIADDIVQEVFLDFWNRKAWQGIEVKNETYLSRAVGFKCIDHLRKNNSITEIELSDDIDDESDLLAEVDRESLQEQITRAINKLPTQCRAVFLLSKYEQLSNQEIASQLDLSVKTVENQMTKAFKVLRKELWPDYRALLMLFF